MQPELFWRVTRTLDRVGARYFVTGSVASMYYGEPRQTLDMDCVVYLRYGDMHELLEEFSSDEFYLSREMMLDAMARCGSFNLIESTSGLKVDFIVTDESDFDQCRFERARRVPVAPGVDAMMSSPEDVIIKKMLFYREGESDKHLRDCAGMLRISGSDLDRDYLDTWVRRFGLQDTWARIRARVAHAP